MVIAIDHGNCMVKTTKDQFVTGIVDYTVPPPLAADAIEWEGKYWALTGERLPYQWDKTANSNFFILTLFAIARQLKEQGELPTEADVDLAVGLPPGHFSTLKEKFAKYFEREGVVFKYNSAPICLNIRKVFVYPQAYAAVALQTRQLMGIPQLFVIDIGGYTVDVLMLRDGKLDLRFCKSLENGVITMSNEIICKIGAMYGINVGDDIITSVLQGKDTVLPEPAVQLIRNSVGRHAGVILDKLRELEVDLRSVPAIFVGGGALLFKPYLEGSPLVARADFIADPRANAIGYETLASAQQQKRPANGRGGENA